MMAPSGAGKTTLLRILAGLEKVDSGQIEGLEGLRISMAAVGLGGCEDQPVREFSGGMRQRTALLRALYSEWDVLFLDEPFKGLDEETKELVIEYTKKQCFGKTVIFVTHDRSEAGKMGGRLFKM